MNIEYHIEMVNMANKYLGEIRPAQGVISITIQFGIWDRANFSIDQMLTLGRLGL